MKPKGLTTIHNDQKLVYKEPTPYEQAMAEQESRYQHRDELDFEIEEE